MAHIWIDFTCCPLIYIFYYSKLSAFFSGTVTPACETWPVVTAMWTRTVDHRMARVWGPTTTSRSRLCLVAVTTPTSPGISRGPTTFVPRHSIGCQWLALLHTSYSLRLVRTKRFSIFFTYSLNNIMYFLLVNDGASFQEWARCHGRLIQRSTPPGRVVRGMRRLHSPTGSSTSPCLCLF